jgi:hypothetical protein
LVEQSLRKGKVTGSTPVIGSKCLTVLKSFYMPTKPQRLDRTTEKQLQQKLVKTLMGIFGLMAALLISVTFFAPKLGFFFGLFSVHRNDPDTGSTIKPGAPIFSNIPNATNKDGITLNGYALSGTTVVLFVNGPEVARTTAGSDGLFAFSDVKLNQGTNSIAAKVIDQQGVSSENSNMYSLVVDKEKPKIEISSPKDGATIRNLDKRVTVTGKVNEKSTIKVNDKFAILNSDLTFEFLLGVSEGDVEIKVEATDEAGNIETSTVKIKYVKSS